jgi:hypothetical protein
MALSRPRKVLTIEEKVTLIKEHEKSGQSKSVRDLASQFKIGKTAAADILYVIKRLLY